MEIIQKFKFYFILGGVLIFYMILYFFFVSPMDEEIETKMGELTTINANLKKEKAKIGVSNASELIKYHKKNRKELEDNLSEMKNFLKDRSFDNWWFKQVRENVDKSDFRDDFEAVYDVNKKILLDKYKSAFSLSPEEVSGKENEDFLPFESNIPNKKKEIARIQKEFWILEGLFSVLTEGKLRDLQEITFEKSKDENTKIVVISGTINYENIPFLTEALLLGFPMKEDKEASDKKIYQKKMAMIELISLIIERKEHNPSPITVDFEYEGDETDTDAIARVAEEAKAKYRAEHEKEILDKLPPVKVKVACRILDPATSKN